MDIEHAWEMFTNFLKSVCDYWFVIVSIIGFVILLAGYTLPTYEHNKALLSIGKVIVFSSVFASFTRWISVRGIVKKTLNEILSSKEFLNETKNFDSVWNNLVEVSIDKYNPSLKGFLENSSIKTYLPQKGELFYSSYSQHFDVSWKDEANKIVKLIETIKVTVKTKDDSLYKMPYKFRAEMPIGANLVNSITTLKVGTQCNLDKVVTSEIETDSLSQEDKVSIEYELNLEGDTEYKVHRVMHREISLNYEPYIILVSGRHTLGPEVSFESNGTGVKATFNSTGTLEDFDTIAGCNNSERFTERHPGLMLKGQGFIVCLSL